MGRKSRPALKRALGTTPEGLPDAPRKMSGVRIARILHGKERGCSFCFPVNTRAGRNHRHTHGRRDWDDRLMHVQHDRSVAAQERAGMPDGLPREVRAVIGDKEEVRAAGFGRHRNSDARSPW